MINLNSMRSDNAAAFFDIDLEFSILQGSARVETVIYTSIQLFQI